MKWYANAALGAVLLAGAAALTAMPASAQSVGFSFGYGPDAPAFSDPCAYYDYYDQPPPWGLPPDYCDYPVYFEPVFFDGYWYRGPIYYRWEDGERLFWLNGGWRRDEWRGPRPQIRWQDRGGWGRGHDRGGWGGRAYNNGGGRDDRGGGYNHWSGQSGGRAYYNGGDREDRGGDNNHWSGQSGGRAYYNGGDRREDRGGGNNHWSGGQSGGGHWSDGGNTGSHSWSGGHGGGGHWSGGGGSGHSGGGGGHGGGDNHGNDGGHHH